jgi:hypothetical protein
MPGPRLIPGGQPFGVGRQVCETRLSGAESTQPGAVPLERLDLCANDRFLRECGCAYYALGARS